MLVWIIVTGYEKGMVKGDVRDVATVDVAGEGAGACKLI